jgi:hypothetical protein
LDDETKKGLFSIQGASMSGITLDDLRKAIDLVCPPLYYGLDKNVKPGEMYLCKETDFNPEFIILHPDDLEMVKSKITARRLVSIKDEPKEKAWERLCKAIDSAKD